MNDRDREHESPDGHLDEDACVDMAAGLMRPDVLDRALKHVAACPTCEERFIVAAADLESIRCRPVPERAPAPLSVPVPAGKLRIHSKWGRVLGLAIPSALAATLLVVILARTPPAPSGSPPYWLPASGDLLKLRGSTREDADSVFWSGVTAYARHDIERARTLLESSKTTGAMDDLRRLYLASLLVNSGRPEESLTALAAIEIEYLPRPWRERASWLEFLALDQLHRAGPARQRLEEMAGWPGEVGDLARSRLARR